jgi:hypothetical protein
MVIMLPQTFIVMRITTTARYSRDCAGQRPMMMNSERVKIPPSKTTHRLAMATPGVKSVTSSKLASNSSLGPMPRDGGPIDAHISRFHATHRNGVATTPRSEIVLQEYLKYDRGMASPLVSASLPSVFVFKLIQLVSLLPLILLR